MERTRRRYGFHCCCRRRLHYVCCLLLAALAALASLTPRLCARSPLQPGLLLACPKRYRQAVARALYVNFWVLKLGVGTGVAAVLLPASTLPCLFCCRQHQQRPLFKLFFFSPLFSLARAAGTSLYHCVCSTHITSLACTLTTKNNKKLKSSYVVCFSVLIPTVNFS